MYPLWYFKIKHNEIGLMQSTENKREVVLENNIVDSDALFGKSNELTIIHNGEEYRLRLTSNSKLILTK